MLHTDYLNTPRLVADATGTTVWRWDQQEPFGNNPADEDPDANSVAFDLPLRLPGQRYDAETGLHYNYFRDYDPSLGIYKQSDLIGLRGGLNTYAYVRSSPLIKIDRTGLVEWEGSVVGGAAFTWGVFTFDLKTKKCVNGKKGKATVVLTGPGLGFGFTNFSLSSSDVQIKDPLDHVSPSVFDDASLDGGFIATAEASWMPDHTTRLGLTLGGVPPDSPTGGGCAAIRLGVAGGKGCGESTGFALGVGVFFGSSTVIAEEVTDCGCSQ